MAEFDWVDKIAKLLALAANAGTEEEADAAMRQAQRLMADRNLTMAQVEMAGGNRTEVKRTKEQLTRGASYKYQQELWATLCEVNFCFHFVIPVYKKVSVPHPRFAGMQQQNRVVGKQHQILGRAENVAAVKVMGEYLEQCIERLVPVPNNERLSKWALSWKAGCAERLCERLVEQKEQMEEESRKAAAGQSGDDNPFALTLVSVAQREYEANMEFQYPGWIARKRAQEQRDREFALALKNQPRDHYVPAVPDRPIEVKIETDKQREAREAKEERQRQRWHDQRQRELAKTDWSAFRAGERKAEDIALNKQIDKGEKAKEIGQ